MAAKLYIRYIISNSTNDGEKYKIMFVDDNQLFRKQIRFVFDKIKNAEIIAEAANGKECIDLIDKYLVDIVLMDISMPEMDGISATKMLLTKGSDVKVVAISAFDMHDYIFGMMNAGAKGYLIKGLPDDELQKAIESVMNGKTYFSEGVLRSIRSNIPKAKKTSESMVELNELEYRVLDFVCNGKSSFHIATELQISIDEVENIKKELRKKTSVQSDIQLIMYSIQNNLIDV